MIEIKNISGNTLLRVPITESCVHHEELMKAFYIKLSWNSDVNTAIPEGSYIEHHGEQYRLLEPYVPTQKSEIEFLYEPQFQHEVMGWDKQILFFYQKDANGNVTGREASWSLTDTPANFMSAIAEAIKEETGKTYTYSVDSSLLEAINISFQSTSIFSALNELAKKCNTEWWLEGSILHLSKCSHGEHITLEVGRNINTPNVTNNKEGYFTRFYAYGSTRNITQDYNSGSTTNHVVEKRLCLNKKEYPHGYKDIRSPLKQGEIFVKTLVFDDIYPSSKMKISDVRALSKYVIKNGENVQIGTDESGNPIYDMYSIWYFRISGFTLTDDLLMKEKHLSVNFRSGQLNGREFELTYHSKASTVLGSDDMPFEISPGDYEINFDESTGLIIPGTVNLIPSNDDQVILFNIKMPSGDVASAEDDLEAALKEEISRRSLDLNSYRFDSNPVAFDTNHTDLSVGQAVTYVNGTYSFNTRVLSVERKLDNACQQSITIGEEKIQGTTQELKEEVVNINRNVDVIQTLSDMSVSIQNAYGRAQKEIADGIAKWGSMWEFDKSLDTTPNKTDTNKWIVKTKYNIYSLGGISAGGFSGSGGGGGASALYQLTDVDPEVQNAKVGSLLYRKSLTHWGYIDQDSLTPDLAGYATESWVKDQKYALQSSLDGKVDRTIQVIAGSGLTGGGSLNSNITVSLNQDTISSIALFNSMFELDTVNGAIKAKKSLYSVGGISAGGFSDSGGGGGSSFDRLDSWGDYNPDKADYVLSAGAAYYDHTNIVLKDDTTQDIWGTKTFYNLRVSDSLHMLIDRNLYFNGLNTNPGYIYENSPGSVGSSRENNRLTFVQESSGAKTNTDGFTFIHYNKDSKTTTTLLSITPDTLSTQSRIWAHAGISSNGISNTGNISTSGGVLNLINGSSLLINNTYNGLSLSIHDFNADNKSGAYFDFKLEGEDNNYIKFSFDQGSSPLKELLRIDREKINASVPFNAGAIKADNIISRGAHSEFVIADIYMQTPEIQTSIIRLADEINYSTNAIIENSYDGDPVFGVNKILFTIPYNSASDSVFYDFRFKQGGIDAESILNISPLGVNSSKAISAPKIYIFGGTSKQFLKADGSLDSNTYLSSDSLLTNYMDLSSDQTAAGVKTFGAIKANRLLPVGTDSSIGGVGTYFDNVYTKTIWSDSVNANAIRSQAGIKLLAGMAGLSISSKGVNQVTISPTEEAKLNIVGLDKITAGSIGTPIDILNILIDSVPSVQIASSGGNEVYIAPIEGMLLDLERIRTITAETIDVQTLYTGTISISGGNSSHFLKGDGSTDSTVYASQEWVKEQGFEGAIIVDDSFGATNNEDGIVESVTLIISDFEGNSASIGITSSGVPIIVQSYVKGEKNDTIKELVVANKTDLWIGMSEQEITSENVERLSYNHQVIDNISYSEFDIQEKSLAIYANQEQASSIDIYDESNINISDIFVRVQIGYMIYMYCNSVISIGRIRLKINK